jgi:hypothetical protein
MSTEFFRLSFSGELFHRDTAATEAEKWRDHWAIAMMSVNLSFLLLPVSVAAVSLWLLQFG